jgi:hypothetical protein
VEVYRSAHPRAVRVVSGRMSAGPSPRPSRTMVAAAVLHVAVAAAAGGRGRGVGRATTSCPARSRSGADVEPGPTPLGGKVARRFARPSPRRRPGRDRRRAVARRRQDRVWAGHVRSGASAVVGPRTSAGSGLPRPRGDRRDLLARTGGERSGDRRADRRARSGVRDLARVRSGLRSAASTWRVARHVDDRGAGPSTPRSPAQMPAMPSSSTARMTITDGARRRRGSRALPGRGSGSRRHRSGCRRGERDRARGRSRGQPQQAGPSRARRPRDRRRTRVGRSGDVAASHAQADPAITESRTERRATNAAPSRRRPEPRRRASGPARRGVEHEREEQEQAHHDLVRGERGGVDPCGDRGRAAEHASIAPPAGPGAARGHQRAMPSRSAALRRPRAGAPEQPENAIAAPPGRARSTSAEPATPMSSRTRARARSRGWRRWREQDPERRRCSRTRPAARPARRG